MVYRLTLPAVAIAVALPAIAQDKVVKADNLDVWFGQIPQRVFY
jgi:hypothetical protein